MAVRAAACAGLKLCEPLICAGLKAVLQIPEGMVDAGVKWVKERFTDHSLALTKAVSAAHDRAWQAVALALATDTILSRVADLFRDGDLKAVQRQIREFVATADTGLGGAADGLRAKACNELLRLKKSGRFGLEGVELTSLDLTRHASSAKVADDAHRAIHLIAADLQADAPHLAQVLTLTPPNGGAPLLAAAFAYFLRRQIAADAELARDLTFDQLRLLTLKQQAGFGNLERVIDARTDELLETFGGWFATADADLADIKAKLEQLLEQNQVSKKPESPLRVSVTSDAELQRLKQLRDRLRQQPAELVDAELQSLLGDGLAAAGQYADAEQAHAAAVTAAHAVADTTAEADAAYKRFKDACELKQWQPALDALNRAIVLDEKRFRPVPKHYVIDAVLGAGSFGVVFKCRNTISFDDDGNELVLAVKTFRETDLDRPLKDVFGEAHTLKNLTHENVIRIHDHGFADADGQQRPFLAMEFVAGVTLEDHLSNHCKLSVADFTTVFRQIAAALHAAHTGRRSIIHRDLKPANVMLWNDGGTWRVKVIDFGLAVRGAVRTASLSVPHSLRATRDRSVTGTIKYAAPEQLGEKPYPPGPWSDVFAFGKTGLESLFGTVQPTPKHWKQLPDPLADLLARCVDEEYVAANPDDGRFHGFAPILNALREVGRDADPVAKVAAASAAEARLRQEQEERLRAEEGEREAARRAEEQAEQERQKQAQEDERQRKEQVQRERLSRKQDAAERRRVKQCSANLDRWKASGEAESWVSTRLAGWDDAAWRQLIESLQRGGSGTYWPMDEAAVGRHLESVRDRLLAAQEQQKKQLVKPMQVASPQSVVPLVVAPLLPVVVAKPGRKAGDRFDLPLPGGLRMAFAWCPPGKFRMGSPKGEKDSSYFELQHPVRLTRGYYCGVHPVTQAEWGVVMGYTSPSHFRGANLPVEKVSWDDAQVFCEKVRELTGQALRLPTEAEWEYACRGGTTTTFYWGSQLNGTQANHNGSYDTYGPTRGPYLEKTTPVGSYSKKYPHPWGLTDVHGNVREWCADWYDSLFYERSPKDDPECRDDKQTLRVTRGGSWLDFARDCRAAYRVGIEPTTRHYSLGFRVVFCPGVA